MGTEDFEWYIYDDRAGESWVVASGAASDLEASKTEAAHYLIMYAQDGPCHAELFKVKREKVLEFV